MNRHLTIVDRAAALAANAHRGQVRKQDGTPYIAHPGAVACALALAGHPPITVAAAYLHDVIEDCNWTAGALEDALGTGARPVVALVVGATEPEKSEHSWTQRKRTLAQRASRNGELGALITADKSHNMRCILDADNGIDNPFEKLNGDADDYLWLTRTLISHTAHHAGAVFDALRANLADIEAIQARHPRSA